MILDLKSYKLSPLLSVTGIILLNAFFGWYNMRSRKLSLIGFETEMVFVQERKTLGLKICSLNNTYDNH